jgi:hypothetical protein
MVKGPKNIDYRPALYSIRNALYAGALINIERNNILASNFERIQLAVSLVAQRVAEVSAAIRNPENDGDQVLLDELAAALENAAAGLLQATAEENAEDGVTPPAEEPAA